MEQTMLSSMPSIIFVRTTYAAVMLFKIFLLATSEDHPVATVLDQERLCLPGYLNRLRIVLANLSHNLSFHGANKFLDIILRLESSYKSQGFNLWPDDRQFTDHVAMQDGAMFSNAVILDTSYANGDWVPLSPNTFLTTSTVASAGANDPLLNVTSGGQYMNAGTSGESFDGQHFSFEYKDVNPFMQDIPGQALS